MAQSSMRPRNTIKSYEQVLKQLLNPQSFIGKRIIHPYKDALIYLIDQQHEGLISELDKIYMKSSDTAREILNARFGYNKYTIVPQTHIAHKFGVSSSAVAIWEKDMYNKLKRNRDITQLVSEFFNLSTGSKIKDVQSRSKNNTPKKQQSDKDISLLLNKIESSEDLSYPLITKQKEKLLSNIRLMFSYTAKNDSYKINAILPNVLVQYYDPSSIEYTVISLRLGFDPNKAMTQREVSEKLLIDVKRISEIENTVYNQIKKNSQIKKFFGYFK